MGASPGGGMPRPPSMGAWTILGRPRRFAGPGAEHRPFDSISSVWRQFTPKNNPDGPADPSRDRADETVAGTHAGRRTVTPKEM